MPQPGPAAHSQQPAPGLAAGDHAGRVGAVPLHPVTAGIKLLSLARSFSDGRQVNFLPGLSLIG